MKHIEQPTPCRMVRTSAPASLVAWALTGLVALLLIGLATLARAEGGAYELPPAPGALEVPYESEVVLTPYAIDLPEFLGESVASEARPSVDLAALSHVAPAAERDAAVQAILRQTAGHATRRATLEQMLYEQLREELPGAGDDYVIEEATLPHDLELPEAGWDVEYRFSMPSKGLGRASYSASITDGQGKFLRRFHGSVQIDREVDGLQVKRVIRKGEKLGEGDLVRYATRLSKLPRGALSDARFVVGTVAQSELRPGTWLTERHVEMPELVRRGQPVTMRLQRGSLSITAPAVAQQNGTLGEVIEVQNAQSGKRVFARVGGPDEVQVIF